MILVTKDVDRDVWMVLLLLLHPMMNNHNLFHEISLVTSLSYAAISEMK